MPCPCFEPERIAPEREHPQARLPLFDEYDGLCHATGNVFSAPAALRFRCCNHGYSRALCEHFPPGEPRSALRYDVLRRTPGSLEVMCIEERDYAPLRWHQVEYLIETGLLKPEVCDACARAQLLAFCRGYLARFSD